MTLRASSTSLPLPCCARTFARRALGIDHAWRDIGSGPHETLDRVVGETLALATGHRAWRNCGLSGSERRIEPDRG
jgi:hypothetical protein